MNVFSINNETAPPEKGFSGLLVLPETPSEKGFPGNHVKETAHC